MATPLDNAPSWLPRRFVFLASLTTESKSTAHPVMHADIDYHRLFVRHPVQVSDLAGHRDSAHPGLTSLGYFFTAVALLGLVNAFNLIDGLDGLSSGLAIIALIGVGVAATIAGYNNYALSVVVMVALCLCSGLRTSVYLGVSLRPSWGMPAPHS